MAKSLSTKKTTIKTNSSKNAEHTKTKETDSAVYVDDSENEDGLAKLFTDGIKDIYWAENALVKALPKMASAAASVDLKKAIENHLQQTKNHVSRLEQVFELLGKKKQAKKCDAMEGLTKEGEGIIECTDAGTPARDLGIIMASRKVEHYEIASYSGLSALAGSLNHTDIVGLLEETLAEEKDSDQILTEIASKLS